MPHILRLLSNRLITSNIKMSENFEHTIELPIGYTDKDGVVHRDVTFGKRPKISDLILIDMNPQAQNMTQYQQLVRRLMITKFGALTMPVALPVFLTLDTADDDFLSAESDKFLQDSRGDRQGEILDNNEARLMFGIEIDGVEYDIVKFGNRLTVGDNADADNLRLGNGVARLCFQIGKQISEIRHSETGLKLEGTLALDSFSNVDSEDFNVLRLACEFFRIPMRGTGKNVSRKSGKNGISDSEGNGLDGKGDSKSADGAI